MASQRTADELEHRRGLVLGLTLAEVLLLLLFVLLLALSWRMIDLQRRVTDEQQKNVSLSIKLEKMEATLGSLAPLLAELQTKGGLDIRTVQELTERISRTAALEEELATLKGQNAEMTTELFTLRTVAKNIDRLKSFEAAITAAARIDPNDPPAVLFRAVEILSKIGVDAKTQDVMSLSEMKDANALKDKLAGIMGERDRIRIERDNLMRRGNGLTYPSCWIAPDGQSEYMFDILIQDAGLTLKDATPGRANDPAMQLLRHIARNAIIDERTFSKATQPVFDWSKKQNCRFYSIIRDATGETSKMRYKQLRKVVENHFYPLLLPAGPAVARRTLPASPTATTQGIGGPFVPVPEVVPATPLQNFIPNRDR